LPSAFGYQLLRFFERVTDKLRTGLVAGAFAEFGSRTTIQFPCRLDGPCGIYIGSGVFVGCGSWLAIRPGVPGAAPSPTLRIGDGVSMSGFCVLSAAREVVIEERVLLARNVYVADHGHSFERAGTPVMDQGLTRVEPVRIGRGAWLGQNVVVCPGVTVGEGAVIGANSVVNRDVPPFSLAVGAPARVLRTFSDVVRRDFAISDTK
jgi:acetyltransferase-like isoleucine patch superfamily enzyme